MVGASSAWIDADARDAALAADSRDALSRELAWAAHLGLQAVALPPLRPASGVARTAQLLLKALKASPTLEVWARVPLGAGSAGDAGAGQEGGSGGGFALWHALRELCGHHPRLCIALEVSAELPDAPAGGDGGGGAVEALDPRWLGEPVRAALLPTDAYLTNKHGYPTLSRRHQAVVSALFTRDVQVVLHGDSLHTPPQPPLPAAPKPEPSAGSDGKDGQSAPSRPHPLEPYREYISYLYRKLPAPSECELAESGYRDYLQSPLQPLADNLESATYETFERDQIKYDTYQSAVEAFLRDKVPEERVASAPPVVLMMVGAGRGPIVAACLRAADATGRRVRMYAIEKNPNAVVTLQRRAEAEGWGDRVTLIASDMRHAAPPEQADALVSELLGSFGDNELSPECLDGAQRFLKPDGVSIPQEYTSYVAPISAAKLHAACAALQDGKDERTHFETPYVCKLHSVGLLADSQPCFTFTHPNRPAGGDALIDNRRHGRFVFAARDPAAAACVHGFAGYFTTRLYGDVTLSIHPPTHTPEMSSWFAIYFPLQHPVLWRAGEPLECQFWRDGDARRVWYEWAVTGGSGGALTHIHNCGGRSYDVGL